MLTIPVVIVLMLLRTGGGVSFRRGWTRRHLAPAAQELSVASSGSTSSRQPGRGAEPNRPSYGRKP